jgi:enediyne biosynthesis protein E4
LSRTVVGAGSEAMSSTRMDRLRVSVGQLGFALAVVVLGPVAWPVAHALDWQVREGFRVAHLPVPLTGKPGFTRLAPDRSGVLFTNALDEMRSITNQIYLNGSGVAAGDADGDGWCDLFFCGIDGPSALFRNLGDWKFADVTALAGVACADQASTGAVFADVDGDGDLDLLVNGLGRGTRLFTNDGKGHFQETTAQAGLGGPMGSMSLALADVDGDGDLDLYVANYRTTTLRDEPDTRFRVSTASNRFELIAVDGRPVTSPDLVGRFTVDPPSGVLEHGEADVLYLNDGRGRFAPVSWTRGSFVDEDGKPIPVPHDWGLSAMFRDLDGDGAPDLYVCNDFQSEDRIWINDGRGRFRAIPRRALRHTSLFSMGVDCADLDRDGRDEIFVADMLSREHPLRQVQLGFFNPFLRAAGQVDGRPQYSRNMLFWNRGDGTYAEIAQFSGVEASDWSWCPVFLDVDLDGWEDLLLVTGHARDAQNIDVARRIDAAIRQRRMSRLEQLTLRRMFPRLDTPNFAFRNRGDLTFEEVGHTWGFEAREISQGIALADLDNDGDRDVAINCLNASPLLYRNDTPAPRIAVRLRGAPPNTQGIGARIKLTGEAGPPQSQEVISGGRYLSADDPLHTFAASGSARNLTLEVRWRSGRRSTLTNVTPNCLYELDETTATASPAEPHASSPPFFADVSDLLRHTHTDEPFDDFQRQPLLPHTLSRLGPGVSWFDIDEDGWEDLIISSGRGGHFSAFRNDGRGGFTAVREPPFDAKADRDQTTVLGWNREPGKPVLLIGSANYEDGRTNDPAVGLGDLASGTVRDLLPGQRASTGPMALADSDADGDLDLFVGGRVIPGRYPEPADSVYLSNDGGALRLDPDARRAFGAMGLVSGAVWSDLDGDGVPELVVACEGGPIRVYRRAGTGFDEITGRLGLGQHLGWWNSVNTGDFDGDGRLDLVAGNWGLNTRYQSFLSQPLHFYHGDLNGLGTLAVVEAYFDPGLKKVVPWRDWETLSQAIPAIRERYPNFTAFSTQSVREVLGDQSTQMKDLVVNTLATRVFLNRGDHFEARALPKEAQWSPAFGIAVGDLDGDGNEDVFISQNFFGVSADTSRHDAGRGLWLRGDGRGAFLAVPARESGLRIEGEGRGVALCDYDHDGRADLAVGQNGDATKLYRNTGGRVGLRVRLKGPPGNPNGVGAVVRLRYPGNRFGPARELHAGAGYWSQDSAVLVLGMAGEPEAVVGRWPGGKQITAAIPKGATDILVTFLDRGPSGGL